MPTQTRGRPFHRQSVVKKKLFDKKPRTEADCVHLRNKAIPLLRA